MIPRDLACLGLALLLACSEDAEANPGSPVECALSGASDFAADCTMERQQRDGQMLLILRHPDGGLRRFELGVEGRGIITADGMEQAEVTHGEGFVEVRVGADRYRLPLSE